MATLVRLSCFAASISLFLKWVLRLSDGPVERFRLAFSRMRLGDLSAQRERLAVGPQETRFRGGYTHSS